jgi:hypothetical protein
MHHSRLCAVLIDCKTSDVDEAARFWGEALGRPVNRVTRLGKLGAKGGGPPGALGGHAGAHRPTLLRRTGAASRFPEECQPVGLRIDLCHLAAALRAGALLATRI